jgi:hypothetical protein
MEYLIDPRKNWQMAEKKLAEESDPRRRQILGTLVAHARAESKPDFEALMATVSERAHYHSHATDDPAQSPKGKDGVAAYYKAIVDAGCHFIEHDCERMAVGRDVVTTEGELKMAYPGAVLGLMGIEVPDPKALYLYRQRLLIVWEFDEDGLVLCEDSYDGGGPKFEGIAERPVRPDQIYRVASEAA